MYADVLLLGLHHPDSFFPHGPDDTENVDVFAHVNLLKDSVQGDESSASANSSTTVHNYGSLIRLDPVSERSNESSQRLGWRRDTKVRPRREVEVLYYSFGIALHNEQICSKLSEFSKFEHR